MSAAPSGSMHRLPMLVAVNIVIALSVIQYMPVHSPMMITAGIAVLIADGAVIAESHGDKHWYLYSLVAVAFGSVPGLLVGTVLC